MRSPTRQALRLLALLLLLPAPVLATDTLDDVLARMQAGQPHHYRYREIRHMELLEDDWQAQGDLFVAERRLFIAQSLPRPLLISITASRMLYLDPQHDVRRVRILQDNTNIPGITPLLQFFRTSHSRAELEKRFRVRFTSTQGRWTLHLVPDSGWHRFVRYLEISGNESQGTDHIHLEFTDNDYTDWFLTAQSSGAQAAAEMEALLQQTRSWQP